MYRTARLPAGLRPPLPAHPPSWESCHLLHPLDPTLSLQTAPPSPVKPHPCVLCPLCALPGWGGAAPQPPPARRCHPSEKPDLQPRLAHSFSEPRSPDTPPPQPSGAEALCPLKLQCHWPLGWASPGCRLPPLLSQRQRTTGPSLGSDPGGAARAGSQAAGQEEQFPPGPQMPEQPLKGWVREPDLGDQESLVPASPRKDSEGGCWAPGPEHVGGLTAAVGGE